jgi:hypothetical protein
VRAQRFFLALPVFFFVAFFFDTVFLDFFEPLATFPLGAGVGVSPSPGTLLAVGAVLPPFFFGLGTMVESPVEGASISVGTAGRGADFMEGCLGEVGIPGNVK